MRTARSSPSAPSPASGHEAVRDAADQGGRRTRVHRAQVQRERVAEPLALVGDGGAGLERLVAACPRQRDAEDHQPLAGQPEAVERVPGAGASLQRRS